MIGQRLKWPAMALILIADGLSYPLAYMIHGRLPRNSTRIITNQTLARIKNNKD